jgi:hypothetical protein
MDLMGMHCEEITGYGWVWQVFVAVVVQQETS